MVLAPFQRGHEQDVAARPRQPGRPRHGRERRCADPRPERDHGDPSGHRDPFLAGICLDVGRRVARDRQDPVAQRKDRAQPGRERRGQVPGAPLRMPNRDEVVGEQRHENAVLFLGGPEPLQEVRAGPSRAEHEEVVAGPHRRFGRGRGIGAAWAATACSSKQESDVAKTFPLQHDRTADVMPFGGRQPAPHGPKNRRPCRGRPEIRSRAPFPQPEQRQHVVPCDLACAANWPAADEADGRTAAYHVAHDLERDTLDAARARVGHEIRKQVLDLDPNGRVRPAQHGGRSRRIARPYRRGRRV